MPENPSLADVRARRAQIAKIIGNLQAEDQDLALAEKTLVRLLAWRTTPIPTPAAPIAAPVVQAARPVTTGTLSLLPPAAVAAAAPVAAPAAATPAAASPNAAVASATPQGGVDAEDDGDGEEEEETAGGVVDAVKEKMTGNENLEELTILMLDECSDTWWTANEIQHHLTLIKGRDVPMASVSPTLTNMKNKGILSREGMQVALASRLAKAAE